MTTTDTPKRLSDDEVAKQFLELEDFLSHVDGHDMTDWSTDESGEMRGTDEGTIDAEDAYKAMDALRTHIAAITAPPSQGKVERAREISHNIVSYCRECSFNLDVLKYTREEAEEYVTSAITQALTESSGQGTDGACCEAMREKAAKAVVSRLSHAAIEWQENNAIRAETYRWAASHAEKAIRALPVSADGRDAVIETLQFYADPFKWNAACPEHERRQIPDFYSETCFGEYAEEALKSKQSSDTGAGK